MHASAKYSVNLEKKKKTMVKLIMTVRFSLAFITVLFIFLNLTRKSMLYYFYFLDGTNLSEIMHYSTVSSSSCQVYPSEYAYRDDSVTRTESASANCRSYPYHYDIPPGVDTRDYIRCDGTQLKLTDFNFGQEQYYNTYWNSDYYYVWSTGRDAQLLFLFPTRVSLTTITLHYYSDSVQGLPRLRFYIVPDDFDIWDAPTLGTPYV